MSYGRGGNKRGKMGKKEKERKRLMLFCVDVVLWIFRKFVFEILVKSLKSRGKFGK